MDNDDPFVGQLLGERYALSRLLGRGGMAAVYQAWDLRLERFVAIKMFSVGTANNDARRETEVKLLARVNHPNLVTLHDAHLASPGSGAPSYLVMEFVEGPDLGVRLAQSTLTPSEAAGLMIEVAEALLAIHDAEIIHRDLKPANILLAPTGMTSPAYRAKIADFGIAHLVGADALTTVGTVLGTAAYLSPEQAMGKDATTASDIYSLGLIMLESLTGVRAFTGTVIEAVSARLARDPQIPATVPVGWVELLSQMTARDPAQRPNALEVITAGRRLALAMPTEQPRPPEDTPTEQMLAQTKLLPVVADPAGADPTAATVAMGSVLMDSVPMASMPPLAAAPVLARRTPTRKRGAAAALVSLIVATIVAIAVGASALSHPGGSASPSGVPTPAHSGTSTTSVKPTTRPSATPTPTRLSTPTPPPTVSTPVKPGKGNNGNGNGNGKHKHP